jgi:sugar phosphate isomerase/epimerase
MARPITLFTGQWADLPFTEVARLAGEWGYDGLEIACWGDHFDPWAAVEDDDYVQGRRDILDEHGLQVFAISNHLTGQAVCDDPIDARHQGILPARVWGDGEPEGVRQRAAEAMKTTARAAAKLGVDTVVGFTGSSIWKTVAMFPPVAQSMVDAGYQDFADRWNPILDVFDEVGVRFAHEVHPSEIAYDYWTTVAALEAVGHRPAFGLNWDPSHFVWQDLDPVAFLLDFRDRIYHVDCKDAKRQVGNGRNGRMGSHLAWADPRRAGTSSPPGTATCRGRRASGCSTTSATPGRSRSSGRTPGWTGWSGPPKRWSSSGGWRSTRRRRRSTRRSAAAEQRGGAGGAGRSPPAPACPGQGVGSPSTAAVIETGSIVKLKAGAVAGAATVLVGVMSVGPPRASGVRPVPGLDAAGWLLGRVVVA